MDNVTVKYVLIPSSCASKIAVKLYCKKTNLSHLDILKKNECVNQTQKKDLSDNNFALYPFYSG